MHGPTAAARASVLFSGSTSAMLAQSRRVLRKLGLDQNLTDAVLELTACRWVQRYWTLDRWKHCNPGWLKGAPSLVLSAALWMSRPGRPWGRLWRKTTGPVSLRVDPHIQRSRPDDPALPGYQVVELS